jgi:putative transposase
LGINSPSSLGSVDNQDSQGGIFLIQAIDWYGGQHGWQDESFATISGIGSKTFCLARGVIKFIDAVLWAARTGSHWRELPPDFGKWNSVFQRYNRWSQSGVWESLFKALADDPDFEYVMMDATIVRAHQHSAGAKGGIKRRKPLVDRAAG